MKQLVISILISCLSFSCNDWLDVQPEASVSKEELFRFESGFFEALNGVYTRCMQSDLYGGELAVGIPEAMAQNYSNSVYDYTGYLKTSVFDFTDLTFRNRRDGIWRAGYNAITNCNLILENIDRKKEVFSTDLYELIKGEALALRAYIHFDLLRLFADPYLTGASEEAIPYVDTYSNRVTPLSTVEAIIGKVLADLNQAKSLLEKHDPIVTGEYVVGFPGENGSTEEASYELFLQNRRHRLNYYAVCGALARVYLYQKDYTHALNNALTVIDAHKFSWVDTEIFLESDPAKKDRIMYKELVFGWYADKQVTAFRDKFNAVTTGFYLNYNYARSIYEVAGVGAEDYRFEAWFTQQTLVGNDPCYQVQKYLQDEKQNLHYLMIPGIRLSEMYYIAAESVYATDPGQAWEYFNTVRFHRGIGVVLDENSGADFITELLKEYRKETYAEGQLYFNYKRLNQSIVNESNLVYPAGPSIYRIPLPEDELEFANR